MDGEHNPAAFPSRIANLAAKFHDKTYRDGYVAAHTRGVLARQMRNFRGDLSQADFAERIGKQKTMISRLENPAYGGWSVRTMLEVARKLNVAVLARFVDFPTFLSFTDDMSDDALCPQRYNETQTDDIVSYLSGEKTYHDLGIGSFASVTVMENMAPSPYGNIFFGATLTAAPGPSIVNGTLSTPYSGIVGQSTGWLNTNMIVGQSPFMAWQPELPVPSGVARTQVEIRRLTNIVISQQLEISALRSNLETRRQSGVSPAPVQSILEPLAWAPRDKQTRSFRDPLGALSEKAA